MRPQWWRASHRAKRVLLVAPLTMVLWKGRRHSKGQRSSGTSSRQAVTLLGRGVHCPAVSCCWQENSIAPSQSSSSAIRHLPQMLLSTRPAVSCCWQEANIVPSRSSSSASRHLPQMLLKARPAVSCCWQGRGHRMQRCTLKTYSSIGTGGQGSPQTQIHGARWERQSQGSGQQRRGRLNHARWLDLGALYP